MKAVKRKLDMNQSKISAESLKHWSKVTVKIY